MPIGKEDRMTTTITTTTSASERRISTKEHSTTSATRRTVDSQMNMTSRKSGAVTLALSVMVTIVAAVLICSNHHPATMGVLFVDGFQQPTAYSTKIRATTTRNTFLPWTTIETGPYGGRSRNNTPRTAVSSSKQGSDQGENVDTSITTTAKNRWYASWMLGTCITILSSSVFAVGPSYADTSFADSSTDLVQDVITKLRSKQNTAADTFQLYSTINDIIIEGKGVGGSINYKGVQLDRGYVADEDTSIYNPGLTLLTESEKQSLVDAMIESRKNALTVSNNEINWNQENQAAFDSLKDRLDPFHVTELRGYLSIFPAITAVVYLAVLAVQQTVRSIFPIAYFIGVAALVVPALALVAGGP